MNDYLTHIFQQFTLKSSSKQFITHIKQDLLALKPIDLTKLYKTLTTSTPLFNQLNLLLAKGVLKYSPANCTVELSLPNVMIYQRMFKLVYFAQQYLQSGVGEFIHEWISQGLENGMGFPVVFEKKKLQKAFSFNPLQEALIPNQQQQQQQAKKKNNKTKSKLQSQPKQKPFNNKQQSKQYNYHKLIYEYKSLQVSKIPHQQQQTQKKPAKPTRKVSKEIFQEPQTQTYQSYMVNVEELTKLMQFAVGLKMYNKRLGEKEKKVTLFEFINSKDREQIMQQIKYNKLEEFIAQILSQNCLLLFNLIKKYPYITQKQLIKLTMLQVLQTRSALNQLLQKGLVCFYNENARTIVYKVVELQIIERKYVDGLGRGMMNLSMAGERITELSGMGIGQEKVKTKLIQLECEMQRLDDLLILFGW